MHTALDPDCYCWYLCDIRGAISCWLGATCKNYFEASSVKKMYCIDLHLPCQGSKSQAFGSCVKNTCVVQRLQRFSRHTYENNCFAG